MGLALAGTMAEGLEAFATEDQPVQEAPVQIGQKYHLTSSSRFTGVCDDSGCESKEREAPVYTDAILRVRFYAKTSYFSHLITMTGNATFVSPVTGTIRFEGFADQPISDKQRSLLKCENLRITSEYLERFSADPVL